MSTRKRALLRLRRTATDRGRTHRRNIARGTGPPVDSVLRRQQRTLASLTAVLRSLQERVDSQLRARAAGDTGGTDELAALRAPSAGTR